MKKYSLLLLVIFNILFLDGCNRNSNSSDTSMNNFREDLNKLHKSDISSISKALDSYRKNLSNTAPVIKDSAFIEFRTFYYNVINSYYEIFFNNQNLVNKLNGNMKDDPEVVQLFKTLDQNGLRLSKTEGGYYIDEKPNFLYYTFKNYVSPGLNDYLP